MYSKTEQNRIHINCDLGEGSEGEELLMPFISACNIACGGHAGTLETMQHTVDLALKHHVEIGAHPSYPDKTHFGRISLDLPAKELRRTVVAQILSLKQLAEAEGGKLSHVKLHGALYHDANQKEEIARTIMDALEEFDYEFALFAPEHAVISHLAAGKIPLVFEAFGDRRYKSESELVPRKEQGALILDKGQVLDQLLEMFLKHRVKTIDGNWVSCNASTYCLHGDTPDAAKILEYLQEELRQRHIEISRS